MTTSLPEVTDRGLVLWQLHRGTNRFLTCSVLGSGGNGVLTVYDPTTPRVVRTEAHTDIVSLVYRAREFQEALLANGWQDLDSATEEALGETWQ